MQLALDGPPIRQFEAQVSRRVGRANVRRRRRTSRRSRRAQLQRQRHGASYGLSSNPFPYSRGVNLNLNYPIFNRFTRENNVAAAQINLENAQAQVRDAAARRAAEHHHGIATLRNDEETMRVQQIRTSARAKKIFACSSSATSSAPATLLDVLTSQSALVTARQQL